MARIYEHYAKFTYKCNHDYFKVVTNEQQAYWLGFISADGYLGSAGALELTLSTKDEAHLWFFKDAVESDHPIRHKTLNNRLYSRLCIRSRTMVADLRKHGLVPNKTENLRWPTLSKKLLPHYLRGYIDGDGGFHQPKSPWYSIMFYLTGNLPYLTACQNHLIAACGLNKTALLRQHNSNIAYNLQYCGGNSVARIANYLYADASIWMDRKREIVSRLLPATD